eukprot:g2051.t1
MRCFTCYARPLSGPRFVIYPSQRIGKKHKSQLTALKQNREEFTQFQQRTFDAEVQSFEAQRGDPVVEKRLDRIVMSCSPRSNKSLRVIDAGCGTGALIPHLRKAGLEDILAIDLSSKCLDSLTKMYTSAGTLGLRTWHGDFVDVPNYMGPVDVIFFNSVFGNFYSQEDVLWKAVCLLQPLGQIVVSHPLGKSWHERLRKHSPKIVPHALPSPESWKKLLFNLPLQVKSFTEEEELYLTVLQVPENYKFEGSPVFLKGKVILGKGLGSKKLGVPTANLAPESFVHILKDYPKGVYFGWCNVHGTVFPAVLNLGDCPTLKNEGVSLEAHILNDFKEDFYGLEIKVALLGFLRPEIKFSGVNELLQQIEVDIGIAKNQLKKKELMDFKESEYLT